MGADFTGGGFEEFEKQARRLEAQSRESAAANQRYISQVEQDRTEQRRLAERARAAQNRTIAQAETVVQRAATTRAPTEGAIRGTNRALAEQRREMGSLSGHLSRYERALANIRRVGPYAFSRSADGARLLREELYRTQAITRQPPPPLALPAAGQTSAGRYPFGAGQPGVVPPSGAPGAYFPGGAAAPRTPIRPSAAGGIDYDGLTRQAASYRQELTRTTAAQYAGSLAMRRHGALTTEFISAAARGETTIRELGFQTTATVGKFAGWLGAGAAIYAVLGAVTALGSGAIDAYSGVNQLERVINNVDRPAAIERFGELADEFNVPVETVTAAAYEMGKVFHDQNSAFEASRSLLFAVKVGELEVADASRYLIGIINAFHLPAERMAGVMDQINAAQNKFGVTIPNVIAGVSKAGGAFAAAGGEGAEGFSQLLALITAIQKASGQTGDVAGTAIARAPNFINQAQNQQALREFGIKAGDDLSEIINEAMEIAPQLSGGRLRDLATAIFGPQYGARVGVPLLRNVELYNKVVADTSPEAAKNSAVNELNTLLGSFQERMQAVIVGLQELGAQLAEAGAFDLLGAGVILLNDILDVAVAVADVFNNLPDGLQKGVAVLAEMLLLLGLLRRFQFGEVLQGGQPGAARQRAAQFFLPGGLVAGDRAVAGRYQTGIRDEINSGVEQRDQLRQSIVQERRTASLLADRARAAGASHQAAEQGNRLQGQALEESRRNVGALQERAAMRTAQAAELEAEERALNQQINERQRAMQNIRRRFGGLNVPVAIEQARREGAAFPSSYERGALGQSPQQLAAAQRMSAAEWARTRGPGTLPPYLQGVAGYGQDVSGQRRIPVTGDWSTTGGPGTIPPYLQAAQDTEAKAKSDASRTRQAASRARASLSQGMTRWSGALGFLGNLMFTGFVAFAVGDLLKSFFEQQSAAIEDLQIEATNVKDLKAQQEALRSDITKSTFDAVADAAVEDILGFPDSEGVAAQSAAIAQTLIERRKQARKSDTAVYGLTPDALQGELDRVRGLRKGSKEFDEQARVLAEEIDAWHYDSAAAGDQEKVSDRFQGMAARMAARGVGPRGLIEDLEVETEKLEAEFSAQAAEFGAASGGISRRDIGQLHRAYTAVRDRYAGQRDAESIQALAQARETFINEVEQEVTSELDASLLLAQGPGDRRAAYATAFDNARRSLVTRARSNLTNQQDRIARLREQIETYAGYAESGPGSITALEHGAESPVTRLERLRNQLKGELEDEKKLREDLKARREEFQRIQEELRRRRFEEDEGLRSAQLDYRASRNADPIVNARRTIESINGVIDRAIRVYGRNSEEVLALLTERQQAITERIESRIGLIEARGELAGAGVTDPVQSARIELATAQRVLERMIAAGDRIDPAELIGQQAQVRQLQADLSEQIADQAEAIAAARFDVLTARAEAAGNEVKAAAIGLKEALYELGHADTREEELQAQAAVIRARTERREAIFQTEIEDIEFQADIGKLTIQQQIKQYQNLLDTMKLNRDMRRDLRRRIYQLRQEAESESGEFSLDVGNIKLPTIYEIRRAVQGGLNSSPQMNVNQSNEFNINGSNADEIAGRIADKLGTTTKSAMRSAGLRG